MLTQIQTALEELGLSKKEGEVFLSMLALGPASVQDIAEKADVNRSTTYATIEGLAMRGLVSSYEKNGKVVFTAESPERLLSMVAEQVSSAEKKRDRLQELIPHLLAMFQGTEDKPAVRFFEGEEAVLRVREEIEESSEPVWEFFAVDEELVRLAAVSGRERILKSRRLSGRALMAIKPGLTPPYFDRHQFEARSIDYGRTPFTGDMTISGKKIYLLITNAQAMIIESVEVVALARALYETAWSCALPWTPPDAWKEK